MPLKNKKKISALFFDLGGVCLTNAWEHESRQKAAKHFSLDFKEMEQRHKSMFLKFECGGMTLDQYLAGLVFYKKRNFSEAAFIRFMQGESKAYATTFNVLGRLKTSGRYVLGVINNESAELNEFRIKKFGLKKYFTYFFSSCFVGIRKPDPRIYKMALQVTQQNPEGTLFIDDRQENLDAAKALKMNVIHVKNVKELPTQLKQVL